MTIWGQMNDFTCALVLQTQEPHWPCTDYCNQSSGTCSSQCLFWSIIHPHYVKIVFCFHHLTKCVYWTAQDNGNDGTAHQECRNLSDLTEEIKQYIMH